ncbi:ParB/RepB/Spo0J family partition protein [Streptomyces sp. McG3]|uniref:ParB/RepB/Spo0J family partition protein n=1 Tax=Streptomyces sp. McG3 TaxID=2725483 RepID=UPI0027E51CEE|nr:ParB/RepB/Spo0J family partition protein [Streptomyces sp. McG3]
MTASCSEMGWPSGGVRMSGTSLGTQPRDTPPTFVPVDQVTETCLVRVAGSRPDHVSALAQCPDGLPPILVHRPTMQVIDGVHRLRAAKLRGDATIGARFVDGSEEDAFVLAVSANVTQGLPLTLADRTSAAARILASHPHLSDRLIASTAGLSTKTVAAIRQRSTGEMTQLHTRLGRDGKVRPLDASHGRMMASQAIANNPDLSLRAIARIAGISVGTARDVRERLRRGEDPIPLRYRLSAGHRTESSAPENNAPGDHTGGDSGASGTTRAERDRFLLSLRTDPSLRFSEIGRALLRLLDANTLDAAQWDRLAAAVPQRWSPVVAGLAMDCAADWSALACRVRDQVRVSA